MPRPCECSHQSRVHSSGPCRKCACVAYSERTQTCSVGGCSAEVRGRGLCNSHYLRRRRHGDVAAGGMSKLAPAAERFWSRVSVTESCWIWGGALDRLGYARFNAGDGTKPMVHRWSYEQLVGQIHDGLELDHLCRVRNCVNPEHLEPVDHRTNSLRGRTVSAVNARKTHCKRGHPLGELTPGRERRCLPCASLRNAEYRARKAAA